MKAFKLKYVICKRDEDGVPKVSTFGEDRRHNRIPLIVDTAADAVLEIAEHMRLTAEAVKCGDMRFESLDEAFGDFVANCSLDSKGNLYIWIDGEHEDEVVYEGTMNSFIHENN